MNTDQQASAENQTADAKQPWTVDEVAKGLGEERARELLSEHLELRYALRKFLNISNGATLVHPALLAEAYSYGRELLARIDPANVQPDAKPLSLYDYVSAHAVRGACTCGKCFDAPANAAEQQPSGHTVDLSFFKVAANGGSKEEFLALVKAEFPSWLDGREHSYLEVGGDIGDQGVALMAIGLGHLLGAWKALTPNTLLPSLPEDLKMQMAGQGFIALQVQP
jgi:hypothetical protein